MSLEKSAPRAVQRGPLGDDAGAAGVTPGVGVPYKGRTKSATPPRHAAATVAVTAVVAAARTLRHAQRRLLPRAAVCRPVAPQPPRHPFLCCRAVWGDGYSSAYASCCARPRASLRVRFCTASPPQPLRSSRRPHADLKPEQARGRARAAPYSGRLTSRSLFMWRPTAARPPLRSWLFAWGPLAL